MSQPVVLYDGSCGLCHRSVKFLLRHERDAELMFAPLQGPTATALRAQYPEIPTDLDTVVLVEGGHARLRSKAILYISHHLRAPWSWAYAMRWLPAVIGDLSYREIELRRANSRASRARPARRPNASPTFGYGPMWRIVATVSSCRVSMAMVMARPG